MFSGFYKYDFGSGLVFISIFFGFPLIAFMVFYSTRLFNILRMQDEALEHKQDKKFSVEVFTIIKSVLFFIIGYKGENREKRSIAYMNQKWMLKYKTSVFMRFFPFYFMYIATLILTTRPIKFTDETNSIYQYSQNLQELVLYLFIYVLSNVLLDFISLYYTIKNICMIIKGKNAIYYCLKDLAIGFVLFTVSQAISCVLWVLKRREQDIPFDTDPFSIFIDITFWPYSFVGDMQSVELIGSYFPGQLLITGTVFFPTVIIIIFSFIFISAINISGFIKELLASINIQKICYRYIKLKDELVTLKGIHAVHDQTEEHIYKQNVTYCNMAVVASMNFCLFSVSLLFYNWGNVFLN